MIDRIRNNAFAKNSLILFIGTMVASVLNYIFHLSIGRMVDAQIYGELESLISFVSIISVPAGTLMMIVTKFAAGNKADDDKYASRQFLVWYSKKVILYGLPIFFLAVIISPFLKDFLKIESFWPLIIVWFMMLLSFFGVAPGGLLNGWQKFTESSWAGVWGALTKLVSALILVYLGFSLIGAVGGFALGMLASYVISLYLLRFIKEKKDENIDRKRRMSSIFSKNYLWPILMGNLAIAILSNVDMVMAKHNLSPELAGQYGALTIISKIILFVTSVIVAVLFSMSSEDNHKKNNSRTTLKYAFFLMSFISAGALVAYYLFPNFIMSILFGNKYQEASPYLIWFAISVVIFSFVNLIFQYLISIDKTKIAYGLLAISLIASIAVLLVGKDIFAIILIMIIAQLLAVLGGVYFLSKNLKKTII
ncbi:MAG: oligosaccharide flippase family protein [Parcubacteria group bacterium]|jgi:O-antigen/teichoic acid export membrane protein